MHDFFLPLLHATDTRSRQFCMTHGLLSPSGIRALQLTSSSKCPGNFSLKLQKNPHFELYSPDSSSS